MTLKSISRILVTTALVTLTLPALAQDQSGPNVGTAETAATPGGPATLSLAYELYELGKAQGDALTVLTAAKLAASVKTEEREAAELDAADFEVAGSDTQPTAKTYGRKKATAAAPASPAPAMNDAERPAGKATVFSSDSGEEGGAPVTATEMFALATELAGDDEALKALIADAEAESSRGAIGGAQEWKSRVTSGQVDVWEIAFAGNSYAEVAVIGDGDANLDMVITDENGNVICYDVSPSDQVYCDFVPAWDGYFYITVENAGAARNTYHLLTN